MPSTKASGTQKRLSSFWISGQPEVLFSEWLFIAMTSAIVQSPLRTALVRDGINTKPSCKSDIS